MGDFIKPEPERLRLSDGQYIDITKRLNHGETEDMYARWAPFVVPGQAPSLDRREVRTAKVAAYLIGWSLTDEGKPVPMSLSLPYAVRVDTIRSLDPDRFDEIHKAIETHETRMNDERAALKKTNGGPPVSEPISPSPSEPAGLLPTSVN